jgi:Retroviral aspartyl protease
MCVLKGLVIHRSRDYPVYILLDSGADSQYVSTAFIRKAQLTVDTTRNTARWVKVANGDYSQVPGETSFTLKMGGYQSRVTASVLNLSDFDIILGLTWLREVNPVIDWKTLRVEVRDRGGELYALPPAGTTSYVDSRPLAFTVEGEIASASQAARVLRIPNSEAYIMLVQPTTEGSHKETALDDILRRLPTEARQLCTKYRGIFQEELPPKLPPTRGCEHTIDTGDATPVNFNSYPLSSVHLAEQSQ